MKSPRCRRMKRIQFGHSDTVISFGKECIEIPGICVLFSKLTSFSAPATQYVCPFFSNFPFLHNQLQFSRFHSFLRHSVLVARLSSRGVFDRARSGIEHATSSKVTTCKTSVSVLKIALLSFFRLLHNTALCYGIKGFQQLHP